MIDFVFDGRAASDTCPPPYLVLRKLQGEWQWLLSLPEEAATPLPIKVALFAAAHKTLADAAIRSGRN